MLNGCYDDKNLDTKIKPFDLKLISELKNKTVKSNHLSQPNNFKNKS